MPISIGLDYGTESCRAVAIDVTSGEELASAVFVYPRFAEGRFCEPGREQFRQHPQDYLDGLQAVMSEVVAILGKRVGEVTAIGIDTTGSTPCAVDGEGTPLALLPEFADDPDAMFLLWKDHSSLVEAERINTLAQNAENDDFTRYSGAYSAEWYWAKAAHIIAHNPRVAGAIVAMVEHGDWLPALLCNHTIPATMPRSRCIAGHKAMWHSSWSGLPSAAFLEQVQAGLAALRQHYPQETLTSDRCIGRLSSQWAERLGLPAGIAIAAGTLDAHAGAVGAGIGPGVLCRVVGTSTCDLLVAPYAEVGDQVLPGINGQVDGSIIPGAIGFEAGQAAFGDMYAWFRDLLCWPLRESGLETSQIEQISNELLARLGDAAENVAIGAAGLSALDWLNGRRSPDPDPHAHAIIAGLRLGSGAPEIFRAIVEATIFGSKAIFDRFVESGISVDSIIACGGIANKSPFIMQMMADVLGRPIAVAASEQTCALGAAMHGACAAGQHAELSSAQKAMKAGFSAEYQPDRSRADSYAQAYKRYKDLGKRA